MADVFQTVSRCIAENRRDFRRKVFHSALWAPALELESSRTAGTVAVQIFDKHLNQMSEESYNWKRK